MDPHYFMLILQRIKDALIKSPFTINLFSLVDEEFNTIKNNSKGALKNTHKLCRKFNQRAQRNLSEQKYDELIQTVEEFIKNYPFFSDVDKAVTMVKRIIPYCYGELLHYMILACEELQVMTCDYHNITTFILPFVKFSIILHKQITVSLLNGSPDIESTYLYYMSGKVGEDILLVDASWRNKQKEVAPNHVQNRISRKQHRGI